MAAFLRIFHKEMKHTVTKMLHQPEKRCVCVLNFVSLFSVCSSVGSATVISPVELIRTKMQAQKQSYRELTDCIRSAVQAEGWLSLWRGLGPTLLRDVPFSALYWYNYEKGKRWLCERNHTREPTFAITFLSGAASGAVSASVQFSAFKGGYLLTRQETAQSIKSWM